MTSGWPPHDRPVLYVEDLDHPDLDAGDYHHASRVLRLRDGTPITVSDGAGRWRPARLGEPPVLDGDVAEEPVAAHPALVGVALIKALDIAVQKLVEVGVNEIQLLEAERSVVRWAAEDVSRKMARLRTIVREAGTQSRRARLPALHAPVAAVSVAGRSGVALAAPDGGPLGDATGVLVGPEGGWSPSELDAATHHVKLGAHVLRAETAAIAVGLLLTRR